MVVHGTRKISAINNFNIIIPLENLEIRIISILKLLNRRTLNFHCNTRRVPVRHHSFRRWIDDICIVIVYENKFPSLRIIHPRSIANKCSINWFRSDNIRYSGVRCVYCGAN